MTTRVDEIARELGLDEEGQEVLDRLIRTQQRIDAKNAELTPLIATRRADVLTLTDQTGPFRITKYRVARILGVSPTTMSNITREDRRSATRETVLGILRTRSSPITIDELSDLSHLRRNVVTSCLKELVRDGLVDHATLDHGPGIQSVTESSIASAC